VLLQSNTVERGGANRNKEIQNRNRLEHTYVKENSVEMRIKCSTFRMKRKESPMVKLSSFAPVSYRY